jgi:hypothetical protein
MHSRSLILEVHLVPHGRAIHLAQLGPRQMSDLSLQSAPKRTLIKPLSRGGFLPATRRRIAGKFSYAQMPIVKPTNASPMIGRNRS